jgi:hypothetical protein
MDHASMTSPSSAWSISSDLTKSGLLSSGGRSSPLKLTWTAPVARRLVRARLQRHAGPARVAHGAVGELAAIDARSKKATAVARALVDGDDFHRLRDGLDVGQ